jgi:alpha-mannosidase
LILSVTTHTFILFFTILSKSKQQHVADDYSKRLQMGMDEARAFFAQALRATMLKQETNTTTNSFLDNLAFCQLLNETKCPVSEAATQQNMTKNDLYVIVYNPLGVERSANVQLPVSSRGTYMVEALTKRGNRTGSPFIVSTICPALTNCVVKKESMVQNDKQHVETKYILHFKAGPIPPVGAAAFRLIKVSNDAAHDGVDGELTATVNGKIASIVRHLVANDDDDLVTVSNGIVNVTFDKQTGAMKRIASREVDLDIEQVWGYYVPFDSEFDVDANAQENSGAYIFRPQTPDQKLITVAPSGARFVNTTTGIEVHVSFDNAPWIKQVTRVLNGQPWVEIGYQVGPVPIEHGRGKEVVTRFVTSSIQNQGIFYTDSNGREFLQRQRDIRPSWPLVVHEPIAGNYYPVNAAIFIQDVDASMTLLVDRSRGGASIVDGSLEVMVQRRTVADDHRGVDEPMNETCGGITAYPPYGRAERVGEGVTVRGTHRIMVGRGSSGARLARSAMDSIFAEPLIFVASAPSATHVSFQRPSFSALAMPLPPNVMLTTLLSLSNREQPTLLVRLGHQYGLDEDEALSKPVKVDVSLLLAAHFKVDKMTEMTLTGNQEWKAYIARRFNWTGTPEKDPVHGQDEPGETTTTLNPMEIRTFEVVVSAK